MPTVDLNINSDITKIIGGLNQAVEASNKLETSAKEYGAKSTQAMMSNKQAIAQTDTAVKVLNGRLKTLTQEHVTLASVGSKMTSDQQNRFASLNKEIEKTKKELQQVKTVQADLGKAEGPNMMTKGFQQLSGVLAATFATTAIISYSKEASKLAGEADGIRAAFVKLDSPGFLDSLRKATRGTVTDVSLMKNAIKASNFKIPMTQLATFFEFATKRAAQTGESVDYLVESIILGIGRKSPLILDNLGISAIALREKFGNVGVEAASVADVSKAMGEIVGEELVKMGDVATTSGQKMQQMAVMSEELKESWGAMVNGIVTDESLMGFFGRLSKNMTGLVEDSDNILIAIGEWLLQGGLVGQALLAIWQGIVDWWNETVPALALPDWLRNLWGEGEEVKIETEGAVKANTQLKDAIFGVNGALVKVQENTDPYADVQESANRAAEAMKDVFDVEKITTDKLIKLREDLTDKYGDLLVTGNEQEDEANKKTLDLITKELKWREDQLKAYEDNEKKKRKEHKTTMEENIAGFEKYFEELNKKTFDIKLGFGGTQTLEQFEKQVEENLKSIEITLGINPMVSDDNSFEAKLYDDIQAIAKNAYDQTIVAQRNALNEQLANLEKFKDSIDPAAYTAAIDDIQNKLKGLVTFGEAHPIASSLGFTDEKQLEQVKEYVGQLWSFANDLVAQQVEATTRIVEDQNTRIEEQQDLVNQEFQLKQEGLANNYQIEKDNLAKMQKARDEAIKDRERSIKIQRTMSTIESGISLVTAAANIIKGFSTIPVVGVVLGLAAVAAMIAGFVAAQSSAKEATQLKSGGRLSGPKHSEGGMKITGTNYEVEGKEWFVNAQSSEKYNDLLKAINSDDQKAMQIAVNKHNLIKAFPVGMGGNIDDSKKLGEIVRLLKSEDGLFMGNGYYIERKGTLKKTVRFSNS